MKSDWMRPVQQEERRLSADDVLELPIGSRVLISGENSRGEEQQTECVVAGHPNRKFLTYRDGSGNIKRCSIKDYPGKYYRKVKQ